MVTRLAWRVWGDHGSRHRLLHVQLVPSMFFMGHSLLCLSSRGFLILGGPVPRWTVTPNSINVNHSFTSPHSTLHPSIYHARPFFASLLLPGSTPLSTCALPHLCQLPCYSHPGLPHLLVFNTFPAASFAPLSSFILDTYCISRYTSCLFLTLLPFTPHLHYTSLHELITHPFIHAVALCLCIRSSSHAPLS